MEKKKIWTDQSLVLKLKLWLETSQVTKDITINPTIDLPDLTQDWEIDSRRAQTEPCVYHNPGEKISDPTKDWPRLAQEGPGVSRGGVGQW